MLHNSLELSFYTFLHALLSWILFMRGSVTVLYGAGASQLSKRGSRDPKDPPGSASGTGMFQVLELSYTSYSDEDNSDTYQLCINDLYYSSCVSFSHTGLLQLWLCVILMEKLAFSHNFITYCFRKLH